MNHRLLGFEAVVVFLVVVYLLTGCTHILECDKTLNRSVPASCNGLYYRGGK